jgi:tripartite-type tricarboxylate transporter receptor subunit TctC
MTTTNAFKFVLAMLCIATSLWAVPTLARYPERQVTIVVPYPPGGVTDVYGRALAQRLSQIWGQPVVVDNKPGGGTVIGTQLVSRASADGYTLLLTSYGYTSNPVLKKSLPYDTKALTPLYLLGTSANMLVINPNLPIKTMNDIVALGKSKPGALTFGSSGNASSPHIAAELFAMETGVKMTHIPYKGTGPAMNDLLGGQIMGIFDGPSAMPRVRAGQLSAIAIATAQRHPAAMEVPTFRELGVDLVFGSWFGFFVPTGTFGDIQNTIIAGIELALKDPTVISAIEKTGLTYANLKQQDYQKFLDAEEVRLRRLIKTEGAGIQVE